MMLNIVLLPQPEGPIRLTNRPCGIESVTGASAWNAPVGVLNVMLTSATQSFGAEDDMRTPRDRVADPFSDYIAKTVPIAMDFQLSGAPREWNFTLPPPCAGRIRRAPSPRP